MNDPFNLERFVDAQTPEFEAVVSELRQGRKTSHWMWFVFPQLKGLGSSSMSNHFGISSLEEAKAYLGHPVLGSRLVECTELVNRVEDRSIQEIFGGIDSLKFQSSMTLFAKAGPNIRVFKDALDKYFEGKADQWTINRIGPKTAVNQA